MRPAIGGRGKRGRIIAPPLSPPLPCKPGVVLRRDKPIERARGAR